MAFLEEVLVPVTDVALKKIREICLALPDTKETLTWGKPHFRVCDKIFAGCSREDDGRWTAGFKLAMDHAKAIVADSRFQPAPYVGHKGWVSMDVSAQRDWDEVRSLVFESYQLIAPKKSLAKLEVGAPAPKKKKVTSSATKRPAKEAVQSVRRKKAKAT